MAHYNATERRFFAKLNFPWYIEDKNDNPYQVFDRLEFVRNQLRNREIELAKYIKKKEVLGRYDLGLRSILDHYDHF